MRAVRLVPALALTLTLACSGDDGDDAGTTGTDGTTSAGTTGGGTTSGTGSTTGPTTSTSGSTTETTTDTTTAGTTTGATSTAGTTGGVAVNECDDLQNHPEWIFCDDFETNDPLVGNGRYFEGDMPRVEGEGYGGSAALEAAWTQGQVGAGGVKLAFGNVPGGYFDTGIRPGEDFQEIYYRMMLRNEAGWEGAPAKLSRATVFAADDWSQAMIAHAWSANNEPVLGMDPVSCVSGGSVVCSGYNDFDNMQWLGWKAGPTPIFTDTYSDQWLCIEVRVKLNTPGQADGIQTIWVNGVEEASSTDLDFRGTYTDYGINAVFFENYWNAGSVKDQKRWFDNIVVSEQPIGCPE